MRKLVRTILALIGMLVIATFAVANRQPAEISFWPLPFMRAVPLYAVLLAGIVIGVILGAVAAWLSGRGKRVALRQLRDRVVSDERREERRRAEESRAAAGRPRAAALAAPSNVR